jgi:hypothetical protein
MDAELHPDNDVTPRVLAVLEPEDEYGGPSLRVPQCPYCKGTHTHGGTDYGYRVSHCWKVSPQQYVLVPAEESL